MRAVGAPLEVLRGPTPVVFVAPHGGRRDPARRPWSDGGLRTNDLGTAELTRELVRATAGSALVNAALDRNEVDLNRISTAHDRAPAFLQALAELLEEALDRHGRVVVLAIHGWNVVQPVVDFGVGYRPGRHAPDDHPGPSASAEFVAGALGALADALAAHGIAARLGVRYPARGRENLLQLFTRRYVDDARPLVGRLARLGQRADGAQLELGLPLRWPGPWRSAFVAALVRCLPALVGRRPTCRAPAAPTAGPAPPAPRSIEFVSDRVCGLATIDRAGGRLLVFDESDRVVLFTGERIGGERVHEVGGLALTPGPAGARRVAYEGPLLRFPDSTPFLDLERGLAVARLETAELRIEFRPLHGPACPFGRVDGTLVLDGRRTPVHGPAVYHEDGASEQASQRLAFHLGEGERLVLQAHDQGPPSGYVCRGGEHLPVEHALFTAGPDGDVVEVRLAGGERLVLETQAVHRLPVVRGTASPPVMVELSACRLAGRAALAGWRFTRA